MASSQRTTVAVAVYGVLGAVALGWGALRGNPDIYHHPAPWLTLGFPGATALSVAGGLAVALSVILITRALVRYTSWARELHVEFRHLLRPLARGEVLVFALTSGIGEELFFRGALQPAVGLVLSGLIFGVVHVPPSRRFLPWTLWAAVMGIVFGALFEATGELIGPMIAHFLINYVNLHYIDRHDPSADR